MATSPGDFQAWEEKRLEKIYFSLVQLISEHSEREMEGKKKNHNKKPKPKEPTQPKNPQNDTTFLDHLWMQAANIFHFSHDLAYPTGQKSSIKAVQKLFPPGSLAALGSRAPVCHKST